MSKLGSFIEDNFLENDYFWSGSNLKEALIPKSTLSFWVVSAYQVALYAFSMFKWTFP